MKMEKDKKYNIILGLMIFFFIIIVAGCLAYGLGLITINTSKDVNNDTSIVPANKDIVQSDVVSANNTEKVLTEREVEILNKKYVVNYFLAIFAGSGDSSAKEIMGYSSYEEMDSHFTGQVIDDLYKVTDIEYIHFINKLSYLSQDFINKLCLPNSESLFKEYNGKLAVNVAAWSGYNFEYDSQILVKHEGNTYEWKVTILGLDSFDATEYTVKREYKVIGRVENHKYILTEVEEIR